MKNSLSIYKYKIGKILNSHQLFIVMLVVLLVLLAVFFRINALNNLDVDQRYVDRESANIKTTTFNEEAIEAIKELNDSNVAVPQTELPSSRQNPFNE